MPSSSSIFPFFIFHFFHFGTDATMRRRGPTSGPVFDWPVFDAGFMLCAAPRHKTKHHFSVFHVGADRLERRGDMTHMR